MIAWWLEGRRNEYKVSWYWLVICFHRTYTYFALCFPRPKVIIKLATYGFKIIWRNLLLLSWNSSQAIRTANLEVGARLSWTLTYVVPVVYEYHSRLSYLRREVRQSMKENYIKECCYFEREFNQRTEILATSLSLFSLFGTTTVPLWTPQLKRTCPGVIFNLSDILLTTGLDRNSFARPWPRVLMI